MALRACVLLAAICLCSVAIAEPVECVTATGQTWRGDTGATIRVVYVARGRERVVEGELISATARYMKVRIEGRGDDLIFLADVQRIETVEDAPDSGEAEDADTAIDPREEPSDIAVAKPLKSAVIGELPRGVLVLPLTGGVGQGIRATEIVQIGKHADTYGPGQIIVFEIESPGGRVDTIELMRNAMADLRKRHRVVAWVRECISGGAATALLCNEIYFHSTGRLGAITMHGGGKEVAAIVMALWIRELEGDTAVSGRSPLFAGPMVVNNRTISYDRNERTGEITYYDDWQRGEHMPLLGGPNDNLVLTADEALHCGFSDGTANTFEELAVLLDLGAWVELDDYGRKMAADWHKTLEDWEEMGPKLGREFQGDVDGPDLQARLGKRIRAGEALIAWSRKLGETATMQGHPLGKEGVERIRRGILELRRQLQQANQR